jgi:hypothetical protein
MPVTAGQLTYACDNFQTCGTPPVTGNGLPPGWSDNMINGVRVILCQVDTPQVATVLPSAAALQTATATSVQAAKSLG